MSVSAATIRQPRDTRGSSYRVFRRSETMSGCGENRSYGSTSQSGRRSSASDSPAKKRTSAVSRSSSRAASTITTYRRWSARIASASARAAALP